LTPVQQGRFVLALKTGHEKMKENLKKWGKRLVRLPGQGCKACRQHPARVNDFWRFGQIVKTKKTLLVHTFFLQKVEPLG
jgi:coenzyme F420-reducing hydrogenase beta subunit